MAELTHHMAHFLLQDNDHSLDFSDSCYQTDNNFEQVLQSFCFSSSVTNKIYTDSDSEKQVESKSLSKLSENRFCHNDFSQTCPLILVST